jgi:hypothetical protein
MEGNELPEHPPEPNIRGFEVYLNGNKLCTAGVGLVGCLNTMVDVVGRKTDHDMMLRVGGLENNEFLTWVKRKLQIGDEITIRMLDSTSADEPISRIPNES